MARSVTPQELMAMKADKIPVIEGTNFPKIIHQSWKSTTLPPLLKTLSETWREQYPEWMHVLWLDSDNLCLVAERFPHHLDFYKAFPEEIYRCDLVRNCYMAEFGGIYVDLDYDSFKPLTPLVQSHLTENQISAFLGRMPPDSRNAIEFPRQIYNAFMASVPGHPFWVYPLQQARNVWYNSEECVHGDNKKIQDVAEFVTGPHALIIAVDRYKSESKWGDPQIVELPAELVSPFAWYPSVLDPPGERLGFAYQDKHNFDLERARRMYDNGTAYCATWWASTWKTNWFETKDGEDEKLYGDRQDGVPMLIKASKT
ncbi:MAG: hypothetical protein CYPHOPRED_004514 [Cyphobasidiales sp. Tagirdzhanova-0007]|nr:MAG: hypothetical protein CYPHOPRED_004514 [Cyphobasidiales sp. Tagirdzhanova-0007]